MNDFDVIDTVSDDATGNDWAAAAKRPGFKHNRLLAALPAAALNRLIPDLKLEVLAKGRVLFEIGEPVTKIYFPNDAIASRCAIIGNGASVDMSIVGFDGLIGVSIFMGGDIPNRAIVQTAGTAYAIRASCAKKEFDRHEAFLGLCLRYIQAMLTQTAQSAACNRHHSIEQQLCRWLLMFLDRSPGDQLPLTQEAIATMLGVRREGITGAAGKLQNLGILEYRRGHITVKRRSQLEALSCECYAVVKKECDRLMP